MPDIGDVAVCHRGFRILGGGEVLTKHLADVFDAPIYTADRHPENEGEYDVRGIPISRLERFCIERVAPLRTAAFQLAWQQCRPLRDFDTIVTSGSEPRAYVPTPDQTMVAYVHAPARRHHDLYQYEESGMVGKVYSAAIRLVEEHNATHPDLFVVNSDAVARRLRKYWSVDPRRIRVVYPPVACGEYGDGIAETGEFDLYLGRLFHHKCVDGVVRAYADRDRRLVVAGEGPEREKLEAMATENVEFRGYVDEREKRRLLAGARAFVMPARQEDFGMAPIEAMASGTPVIGVREGFTRHQVLDGKNGILYDRGDLPAALRRFDAEGVAWSPGDIEAFAARHFDVDRFASGVRDAVDAARRLNRVSAPWEGDQVVDDRAAAEPIEV